MYSILTYISASKTIDFLIHGVEEYTAITIVSPQNDLIKDAITNRLNRGVTILKGGGGIGGHGERQVDVVLYCVVTRLEIGKIKDVAKEIDPHAFITTHSVSDVDGGLVKRPLMH
jgi:uncharacterized membrane-anchored protein YitT (DUF2179 family)